MVSPVVKQTWTIMGVLTNMFGLGMFVSHSSILLPALLAPGGDIKVDLSTASWIVSVIGIAVLPGHWVASLLMDVYGRRLGHGILCIPAIGGWVCVYFANNVTLLIVGRSLTGFAAGGLSSLGCVVIGEYTSPKNRGVFMTIKTGVFYLGSMVMHLLGHFYDWRSVIFISLIPLIISLIITYTWPESPSWLVLKKRYYESEKSFYWLRGKSKESKKEIEHLQTAQKEISSTQKTNSKFFEKFVDFFKTFKRKDFIKPAMIIIFSKTLLEACGRYIFPAFAMQIVEGVTGNKARSLYYTLGIDITITLSSTCSFILFKLLKRRTLLFSTGFVALFVLYTACGYLYLVSIDIFSNERTYIPIILFVVYFFLSNLGCNQMPFVLMGEIFPLIHRGAGVCVMGIVSSLGGFTTMAITPYLLVNTKVHGTFAILGIAIGICLIVLWFILPETKDRTLQEIEDFFMHGKLKQRKNVNDEASSKMIPT